MQLTILLPIDENGLPIKGYWHYMNEWIFVSELGNILRHQEFKCVVQPFLLN